MTGNIDEVRTAIAGLLTERDPELRKQAAQREFALYLTLSPEKRAAVDERLSALAAMPLEGRTVADIDAAASKLGVVRSNVYRLMKRVEEVGPIGGLVSGRQAKERASAAREGLGEPIDGWIREALKVRPDASMAEIQRMITSRVMSLPRTTPDGTQRRGPAQSALQRRINELRRQGIRAESGVVRPGTWLIIDHGPLKAAVAHDLGVPHGGSARAVLIIDGGTSLVLGAGLFLGEDVAGGLARAIACVRSFGFPGLSPGFRAVDRIRRISWAVPPDLTSAAFAVVGAAGEMRPGVATEFDWGGGAGRYIFRQLGGSVGRFSFRARASSRAIGNEVDVDFMLTSLEEATMAFEWETIQRNRAVMGSIPHRRFKEDAEGDVVGNERWAEDFDVLFAAVPKLGTDREDPRFWSSQADRRAGTGED